MSKFTRSKVRIGDLGKIVTGKTPPTSHKEYYGDIYPFITPTDISDFKPKVITERYLSEEGKEYQKTLILPEKTICYTCIASIGKICITDKLSFTNQQINSIIVDHTNFDFRYIYYKLIFENERIKKHASGSATPIINKTMFSNIELDIPPLPAQKIIGEFLYTFDELIENNTRRIQILEEMAQMIYREWFVNFRFPGYENTRMVDSELGLIPEGWHVDNIGRLLTRLRGVEYRAEILSPNGKIPVFDQSEKELLGFHNLEADFDASPENPILLFGDHTCKTELINIPCSFGPNTLGISFQEKSYSYWGYYNIKFINFQREYKRHWNDLISKTTIKPSIQVCEYFFEIAKVLFNQITILNKCNLNLRKQRDLLIPKLISGEISIAIKRKSLSVDG
jgi:type I restriction enzyme, S subunit